MAKDSIDKEVNPVELEGVPSELEQVVDGVAELPDASRPSGRGEIIKSATLVMLGNLGSSVMGMLRQSFVASTGASLSGPFFGALSPAQKFNDFLINGSVGGALVPTFNDYAAPEKRDELRCLIFTLVNLVILIMAVASLVFLVIAPWVVSNVLEPGFTPSQKLLTIQFARIIFFSLMALGPFAVLQGALYARKEFGWAAFAITAYHVGIIVGAIVTSLLGEYFLGTYGLAFGVILGAMGQIGLLLPGLRKQRLGYMFVLDLNHPAIRRILKLYIPIAFSYIVSNAVAILDQSLASSTPCASFMSAMKSCGASNYSAMTFATTLIQFPIGLVAAALGFAILPTLTSHAREGHMDRFKDTLALGFRLGLLLMVPAAAGLIVLRMPIVAAIFQRHNFSANDTMLTATALQNYAYQLPFVAIDQLLISAFYARKNTIIPVAVLLVGVLGYLAVALPFWHTIGMPALAFANAVQNSVHAVVLLVVLRIAIGPLKLSQMIPAVLKIVLATAVMVAIAWGLQTGLGYIGFFAHGGFVSRVITVIGVGGLAAGAYFGLVMVLKVEEVTLLKGVMLAKLGKK
ncbi:MAG TPA: lipid II flippase MurJ [Ktedonobacteraceae bacterium]|nr:lipid II flippase MurJ [Ktedonobacteraceae bacterium]